MQDRKDDGRPRRDDLDFWRGVLFCTIFINHIPGNVFESLTQKNYGFSDAAEAFVFVSGLSLALAYGGRFCDGDWFGATLNLARRALTLYGVHIALSLAGLAIFGAGAVLGDKPNLLKMHGRDLFLDKPAEGLVGLISLGHQLGYFNILPMYVLMLMIAPVLLWIGRTSRPAMVALSGLLYLVARLKGWNLPTWPVEGTWFFDPFAWQFLMAIGMACGLGRDGGSMPRSALFLCLSLVIVGFGLLSVTNGFSFVPGLQDWTRAWADIDKTNLGLGRLVHFLCVVYLIHAFRVVDRMRRLSVFDPLCLIGRGGLWIFSLLSLLAAVGQVSMCLLGHRLPLQVAMISGGLVVLLSAARHLQMTRAISRSGEPGPTVAGSLAT